MPCSSTGAPACSLTPPGRKFENARCAVIASALTPTTSLGRPGRWTSPAEIMVVTPPWRKLSIQFSWLWRGVQSPNTGCTWLSIRPGASVVPFALTTTSALPMSTSWARPTSPDPAVDGDDRVGFEQRLLERPREQRADVPDHQLARDRSCPSPALPLALPRRRVSADRPCPRSGPWSARRPGAAAGRCR